MQSPHEAAPETDAAATAAEVDAFMEQEMKKADADKGTAVATATQSKEKVNETTQEAEKILPSTPAVPPAVAALDASLEPFLKPIRLRNQYIAVRVGYATCNSCIHQNKAGVAAAPQQQVTPVRNAIFFSWEDAKAFVDFETQKAQDAKNKAAAAGGTGIKIVPFYSNVEWKAFDALPKAEAYLRKVLTTSTAAPEQKNEKISLLKKTAKKKKTKVKHVVVTVRAPPRNRGPPTKKWMAMHDLAKAYKSTHDNLDVPPTDTENAVLFKWIKYQRDSYRLYLEDPVGGLHSMTDEKVNMLKELGFTWIQEDKHKFIKRGRPRKERAEETKVEDEDDDDDDDEKSPAIRQKWMEMYEKLKSHVEQYGTTDIPKDTEDDDLIALRTWCASQKNRYSMIQRGQPSRGMTSKKIELLKSIGFAFPANWNVMYSKLVAYKKEHGHTRVTTQDDAALAKWLASQNEVLGRHLQGKGTRLGEDQVMKLMSIGLVGGRRSIEVQELDSQRDEKWNEMFLKLRAYKAEHGHCNPPTSSCTDLSNWVAAQRRMYNKLIQGKPGKRAVLDAVKMQRLTELGFAFRPRGSYLTWEDQMEKLTKFKNENGHCKVPVNDEVLGSFVKLARREYKLKQQGKKSSMTEDRERDLRNLGFVFEGGKTPQRSEGGNKTWDERFEELLAYKEEHGHTVVPQNSGRLGQWVHSQRVNYKKLKAGKSTSMTAEKALQLTEIGFCFNASDRFRGNKQADQNQAGYAPMYAHEVPHLPPTDYAWRGGGYTE